MSLIVFYKSILSGSERPKFTWEVKEDHSIVVKTTTTPTQVNLWQATNTEKRDFRLETIGAVWKSSPLSAEGANTYIAKVPEPEGGWTAFFVELVFDSGSMIPFKFTTEVHVVPECLPFAQKLGFDADWDVDFEDLRILCRHWLTDKPSFEIPVLCGDGLINFLDYGLLAGEWQPARIFAQLAF